MSISFIYLNRLLSGCTYGFIGFAVSVMSKYTCSREAHESLGCGVDAGCRVMGFWRSGVHPVFRAVFLDFSLVKKGVRRGILGERLSAFRLACF